MSQDSVPHLSTLCPRGAALRSRGSVQDDLGAHPASNSRSHRSWCQWGPVPFLAQFLKIFSVKLESQATLRSSGPARTERVRKSGHPVRKLGVLPQELGIGQYYQGTQWLHLYRTKNNLTECKCRLVERRVLSWESDSKSEKDENGNADGLAWAIAPT